MSEVAQKSLDNLLSTLGLNRPDVGGDINFQNDDPIVGSRHRYGAASASVIAAEAAGIATIWNMRSGRGQDISIDLYRAAIPGLRTSSHIYQNGHYLHYNRDPAEAQNFFLTKDNRRIYVLRTAAYGANLVGLLGFLKCENSTASIEAAIAKWHSEDLEEEMAHQKLVGAIARTREEWLHHPQGNYLNSLPPVYVEKIGDSEPEPFEPAARPLSDIRVLDMSHVLAGPISARVLAEQGADVLHISAPLYPDDFRVAMDTGFGKRNAYVDLGRNSDLDELKRLICEGDIFVQSFRPGSLAKRGLSPEDLAALRPGTIYVSISAYGNQGPWKSRGGFEPVGQTTTGLAIAEGSHDEPILAPTFTLNDYLAAYLASAGAVAALVRRAREGGSYHVQVSLARCSMWVQELGLLPEHLWPKRKAGEPVLPELRKRDLMETDCVFGRVRHAKPIAEFSETTAYWTTGPSPLGTNNLFWLPR